MITVVGIGADGWDGLTGPARAALGQAAQVVGSARQLDLLPAREVAAVRTPWPSPLAPLADELAARAAQDDRIAVLASGDPMLHGIGATLVRAAGAQHVSVIPHPSAFALACARMGWPQDDVELVSTVARDPAVVLRALQPGRRIVAYVTGTDGAARLAAAVTGHGAGASAFTVLEQLGGPGEQRHDTTAARALDHVADPLHVVALQVAGGRGHARTPGLPDDAFVASDGQLTKRHIRAVTVAALGPLPGELLWDVGAGNGSVAIEWLRAERTTRAIAVEPRADRLGRIAQNAAALGVPELDIVEGRAPAALAGLAAPDVIFVGGGLSTPGLLDACWNALKPGGRIVANVVTLEGEQAAFAAQRSRGGTLTRIDVAHAEPIGTFTGWRAQMTVVQWSATKAAT
ncbi:Precorrin-6Y C(5,15)-methyltransferase [decarboxylating] [Paraconexibacter sp. AEG42_29]|uniref:Precorrin-6Y C(5,15)-methyltransferase [decarboxylating] n=1 Tax=Paraconexibacter sp. AEG42_29 TaxID=2997339 RepID=A0AAU7AQ48_9ACTN